MEPVPVPQPESQFYWQKASEGELWFRRCNSCGKIYFYPRDICPGCFSRDTSWMKSSGQGTLYSFAIVHRPPTPAWREAVPYIVAIVELEGGVRIPTNLVDIDPDPEKIHIGMLVDVTFKKMTDQISIPIFIPRI